jgi:hypothetical protein
MRLTHGRYVWVAVGNCPFAVAEHREYRPHELRHARLRVEIILQIAGVTDGARTRDLLEPQVGGRGSRDRGTVFLTAPTELIVQRGCAVIHIP